MDYSLEHRVTDVQSACLVCGSLGVSVVYLVCHKGDLLIWGHLNQLELWTGYRRGEGEGDWTSQIDMPGCILSYFLVCFFSCATNRGRSLK